MKRTRQKLLGSLRGEGELRARGQAFPVRYELDRFTDGVGPRASGSVSGELSALATPEDVEAVLVLQDGAEVGVLVSNAAADGADVEATGPTSQD